MTDDGNKGGGGGEDDGGEQNDDVFLKKIESSMLVQVKLQGIEGIRKVFLREAKRTRLDPGGGGFQTDNEWVLDTEGE
jgi:DNA-directed RNA polymerase II subunit RPB1